MPVTRLSWQANGGSCAVAVAAHRAAAAGVAVRDLEGDFAIAEPAAARRIAQALGIDLPEERAGDGALLRPPRIALFSGDAAGYPYYAWYAHCLLSLGLGYRGVSAVEIASGALDQTDLLVIPGGFAIWGLDRGEGTAGADAAVRAFLRRGGAAIGSCGGAFYLSAGRPRWTATAGAKPKYTHEYLQTGAAVVNVRIEDARLGRGCPAEMEIPYYHGPAYPEDGGNAEALARFGSLCLPSRLFIDNPLERESFERDLAGRPAALLASGTLGRAVLFSPHPEMGDIVRKHIALDGYVRRYLPVRGRRVMEETLRHYAPEDAPAFRLVLNAVWMLGAFAGPGATPQAAVDTERAEFSDALQALDAEMSHAAHGLHEMLRTAAKAEENGGWRDLVAGDLARQESGWREARDECTRLLEDPARFADGHLLRELTRLARDAASALATISGAPLIHGLALFELPQRLLRAAARILVCDLALRS